jgi:hypothetical protein
MPFHRGACPFSLSSTTTTTTSCPIFLRRELQMDVLLSVVVGELTARSINYFINRRPKPQALDVADHLRRVVLRSQVIVGTTHHKPSYYAGSAEKRHVPKLLSARRIQMPTTS